MPTITDSSINVEPEEEDMEQEEENDDRKTSEEETASVTGSGEEDQEQEQEEDEDEGVSSEMDEEECERRKNECLDGMNELNSQFCKLKDQLFSEREALLENKLKELDEGTDPEYLYRLGNLEEAKEHRLQVAEVLYQMKLAAIQEKFCAEETASLEHMNSELELAFDHIKHDLEEKIKRLEDDRNNIDITSDLFEIQNEKKKKKHDPFGSDRRKKPTSVSGPYIVYQLKEEEIIDDWTAIKRATKQARLRKVEV